MTDFQTGVITLMKCAITGERAQLPDSFSIEEAEIFAVKQNITTLIYEGAIICGISPKKPAMQRMFQRYVQLMMHSERQIMEVEQLFKIFEENGVDYLPLKGCNMKKLYPKPELRYMGDVDILIRTEQYDRIRPLMTGLGFSEGVESHHEYKWRKADIHIELHKMLIPSTSRSFYNYWGTGWEKAKLLCGSRYILSPEDDFLFQFTHFAKHYMGPGVGCRYLLDLWIYLRMYADMDFNYLEQELSKLHLLEFYRNIQTLLSVWFDGQESDSRTSCMTDFIFCGGSWGNWKNEQLSTAIRGKKHYSQNKWSLVLTKVFPPPSRMICSYPILKTTKFLLPLCWLHRIIRSIIVEPQRISRGMYILTDVSEEKIVQYRAAMQYVGLNFEE